MAIGGDHAYESCEAGELRKGTRYGSEEGGRYDGAGYGYALWDRATAVFFRPRGGVDMLVFMRVEVFGRPPQKGHYELRMHFLVEVNRGMVLVAQM